jgi:hypothetical protein
LAYSDNASGAITSTQTAANTFLATTDRYFNFPVAAYSAGATGTGLGAAVVLGTGTPYTQPGTAAGTATCTAYYSLVDF